jgi:sterol desaturase/sphingolipid hydroxylase (fatty acid hydroxylase superfamily)
MVKRFYWSLLGTFLKQPFELFWWVNLAVAALIVIFLYLWRTTGSGRRSLRGCLRFVFPRSAFLHRSALIDYRFYLTIGFFLPAVSIVSVELVSIPIASRVTAAANTLFGNVDGSTHGLGLLVRGFYTALLALTVDFGYFVAHFWLHKSALLWEFHKVHHAAEVLNPVSAYRVHPLENALTNVLIGLPVGLLEGVFRYVYGDALKEFMILETGVVMFVFNFTANLRHSHVWLSYGSTTSHIFCSPAQHQIHHSCERRHLDTNFGRIFSLWDWMAGTLYVPERPEQFRMGLTGGESKDYLTLWGCYITPFLKAHSLLKAHRRSLLSPEVDRPDLQHDACELASPVTPTYEHAASSAPPAGRTQQV